MTVSTIAALLGAFTAALEAEEALFGVALPEAAQGVRVAIEALRGAAREAIEAVADAPGGAFERVVLLRHAVDFEGANSLLVARCARALAEAISPDGDGVPA